MGVLLAHGAGAGQRHWFMAGLRNRLAASGLSAMTFDYPYLAAGRKAPDRIARLLECHSAAYDRLAARFDRIVVAGKSMGGRVAGHLVAERRLSPVAVVFFGYPLVTLGNGEARDTTHLERLPAPILFIQGERDRLGPPERIRPICARLVAGRLEIVPNADHGFSVPKRTGLVRDDVLDLLVAATLSLLQDVK